MSDDPRAKVTSLASLLWVGRTPKEQLQEDLIKSLRCEVEELEEKVRRLRKGKGESDE